MIDEERKNAQIAVAELLKDRTRIELKARPGIAAGLLAQRFARRRVPGAGTWPSWHQRTRQQVAGQHGEHHRFGQRHKQIPRHAAEEEHGDEHDADAERGDERRDRDLAEPSRMACSSSLPSSRLRLMFSIVDGGVIHEDADRERHPTQRHDVDGLAQRCEHR